MSSSAAVMKSLLTAVQFKKVVGIDTCTFKLHYLVTVIMLTVFAGGISLFQVIGKPIQCIFGGSLAKDTKDAFDTYCWIHSTFSAWKKYPGSKGTDFAYPGVQPVDSYTEEIKIHRYYQWVYFILLVQAFFFYAPHYLWKCFENGRIKSHIEVEYKGKEKEKGINRVTIDNEKAGDFFISSLGYNKTYAYFYLFCEILNFINAVIQLCMLDTILGHEFSTYGLEVMSLMWTDSENRQDPMEKIFPKMSKCTFNKYGPAGSVEPHDGLCVLTLNIVNEKIFVILWFWIIILIAVSFIVMVFRLSQFLFINLRFLTLRAGTVHKDDENTEYVCRNVKLNDWFFLHLLKQSMQNYEFTKFINYLAESMHEKSNKQLTV